MRTHTTRFRLTASLAAFVLLAGPMMPTAAFAQTAQSQGAEAQSEGPVVDPPSRVGRIARLSGTVSYHGPEQTQWEPAVLNFPVSTGSAFWTEPNSGAELETAGTRAVLAQSTQLDIDDLSDHAMTATLAQGSAYFAVRGIQPGDTIRVRTPRGSVSIAMDGQYELTAGDSEHPTLFSVATGQAQVSGDDVSLVVAAGQTAQITGPGPFQGRVGPLAASPVLQAYAAPRRAAPQGDQAPPPVVQDMTGGEALAETGRWERSPDYGQIWYPPVERDWVPYRQGHWAFVAPWGWTWVDDAPWGFAPFHYGRWVEYEGRWGWTPVVPGIAVGYGYRPAYSPALVAFVGVAAGVGIGFAIGRSVGWVPLGPREPYYPPYRTSQAYVRNMNVTNVTNVSTITTTNIYNQPGHQFVNRSASTVVPASAMTGSQPVARHTQQVPRGTQFQAVQTPAVAPTTATRGVTPAVASRMNLGTPADGTAQPRPAAPGPAVRQSGGQTSLPLRTPGTQPSGQQPSSQQPGAQQPGAQRPEVPLQSQPRPGVTQPQSASPTAQAPTAPGTGLAAPQRPAAPGPAIIPRQPQTGATGTGTPLPQLRPTGPIAPAPATPATTAQPGAQRPNIAPGSAPAAAQQGTLPQLRQPGAPQGPQTLQGNAPQQAAPRPATPQQAAPQQTTPQQSAPHLASPQQTTPQIQRPASPQQAAPQLQRPATPQQAAPQLQRPATPQQAAPQLQRPATPQPQPQVQRPSAPQQTAPQVQRPAAPQQAAPQQHYSPPPQQHASPPPQPQRQSAPPQQHQAPRSCPPNRPNC